MRWKLVGTDEQNALVERALDRCTFPWERWVDRREIPVEWDDLSRYAARAHVDGHGHDDEDGFDVLAFRRRVLGLAWYSGRVTIERTLVSEPELAQEVFLSEGAHMLDFFGMTDPQRVAIWNAVHPPHERIPEDTPIEDGVEIGHGHGWFDVATYRYFVGEAWMGAFVDVFSDLPVTLELGHTLQPDGAELIRAAFADVLEEPERHDAPWWVYLDAWLRRWWFKLR